jgi:poly-beta-hydroxyalkanoate depolymerase
MPESIGPQFPAAAFLWPALAAEQVSEFASFLAKEFANFAIGPATATAGPEPCWITPNQVLLELDSVRLRDFSTSADGTASLICAPYALHGATITDLAPGHSLVAVLRDACLKRLFVTDWRSATPEMRFHSIDNYLADLNVLVDELGGRVNLIGLCQGGWMALIYAARFACKVRTLVLAGAPIDIGAGRSRLSDLARNTPISVFKELVEVGHGRVLGQRLLPLWNQGSIDREMIHRILQCPDGLESPAFQNVEARFRQWQARTVDLPGTYYLQVVERLFKQNQLPAGSFEALGRAVDLSTVQCPIFLLSARDDEIVAAEQLFAVERLVGSNCRIQKTVTSCTHLGLFMGHTTLSEAWPILARWIAQPLQNRTAQDGRPATVFEGSVVSHAHSKIAARA